MEIFNWDKDIVAGYRNDDGRESITLTAKKLEFEQISSGSTILGHAMSLGRGPGYLRPKMVEPKLVQYIRTESNGLQSLTIQVPQLTSTVGFMDIDMMKAELWSFGLRIDKLNGRLPLWMIFLRPPASEFTWVPEKSILSVSHEGGLMASVGEGSDGGLEVQLTLSGSGYRRGELLLRRTMEATIYDETIGEVKDGSATLEWKPIRRNFDCLMVFSSELELNPADDKLSGLLKTIGAEITTNVIHDVEVRRFVSCDGPGVAYSLVLVGHRLLSSDEDHTPLSLISQAR